MKRLVITLLALFAFFAPQAAEAKLPQTTVGNPPPSLAPRPTKTGHEIGAATHLHFGPGGAFLPRFRYRYIISATAAQGPLSGFWLEAMVGPAIFLPGITGNAAFNLGYEFDPFRNLALTFSPVLNNDFFFDDGYFRYSNTVGAIGRLYMGGNWVFYFEPASFGWNTGTGRGVGFSFHGGAGFGYKF